MSMSFTAAPRCTIAPTAPAIVWRRRLRALIAGVAGVAGALFIAGCGGSDSSADTATAPTISSQPASLSVASGAAASFSVTASGSGTLGYQWRKGGSAISGATSASYAIAAAATSDAGSYDVIVSNAAGSVTSSAATLTVTTTSSSTAPAISTQPLSQTVASGASATFTVVATGTAPLSYQWQKDGSAIANATAASYVIAAVSSTSAGSYTVTVSNSAGTVTSSAAVLTVSTASSGTLSADVATAAASFLATLSTSQQSSVQLSWTLDTARRWSNLPAQMVARNGLSWGSLSTAQQTAARTMIATALSASGNALHIGLQAADDYLAANGGGSSYGNGNFYIALLGAPSSSSFWMLQLSGHHLTYNLAFNGTYKSPTPLFLGIEPKASFTQGGTTYDPMQAQRTAFSDLGAALTGYASAKLGGTYSDLLFGANGSGNIDGTCPRAYSGVTEHGLPYASLSSTHQALAQAAIKAYVNTQATEYANDLLGVYLSDSALAQSYVAYSGSGTVTTNGNYFRIEGPRLWIEFSVQRGVIFSSDIHYHTIWRDKSGDYGGKCS
ncbi:MAG: DUF3500 domain-containing protein [Proteobacteria bacterium]|nr:DUF3500 domain-containing protein [Pseudomonadota bacterium]